MTLSLKKTIRFFMYLLPAIVMFGSYAVLFKIPGIGYLNVERLSFYLVLLLAAVYAVKAGKLPVRFGESGLYALFFTLMLLYATLSLLWVKDIWNSFCSAYLYLATGILIILFIAAASRNFHDITILLRVATICYLATVALGIYEIFTGHYLFTQNRNALFYKNGYGHSFPYGTFYNMNDYAAFVVLYTPFAVFQICRDLKGPLGAAASILTVAAGLFTVFNANARICYFAAAVFALAFFAALGGKPSLRRYLKPILAVAVFAAAVFLILLLTSTIHLNVFGKELASIGSRDHSMEERGQLTQAGLSMLIDYKGIGVGIGNSVPLVPFYTNLQPINLHNMPLQIATEYGILIFALYFLMLISLGIKLFRFRGGSRSRDVWSCICFASLFSFQLADFASSDAMHVTELWIVIALWIATVKVLYAETPRDGRALRRVGPRNGGFHV